MGEKSTCWVAVDAVILTISDKKLQVLLHKREKAPFQGRMELIGGLLQEQETAEQTLHRKLLQMIGKGDIFFQQFHTFTDPKRDPRERAISIGFVTLLNPEQASQLGGWHDCDSLPALAFDHHSVVSAAVAYLRKNPDTALVRNFLPPYFPLNRLQEAHEVISRETYDNRNFRKKMLSTELVVETEKREANVSHRPARLFKFRRTS